MLMIVTDQVGEREAIMTGDEVDGGGGAAGGVEVWRAQKALRHVADLPHIALEKLADAVAVLAIPLRPSAIGWEGADLIEPTGVPGLSDQLGLSQHRVHRQSLQQWWVGQWCAIAVAAEDAGQV